jgi:hypothetical protein
MRLIKEWLKCLWRNKVAALVVLSMYPVSLLGDLLSWIAERLYGFGFFMIRWMKLWTGKK